MGSSRALFDAQLGLENAKKRRLSEEERIEHAIELAGLILAEAKRTETYAEKHSQSQLAKMLKDPVGKAFATSVTDQCFRSHRSERIVDQFIFLIDQYGIPRFFSPIKKIMLICCRYLGSSFSFFIAPLIKRTLRKETSKVILPGEPSQLLKHMIKRKKEGVRINLNHLGEAVLSEEEALRRLEIYLEDLANPEVEYISVKISTIFSQISLLGWEDTLSILKERLKRLYRAGMQYKFILPNGKAVPKFINLDMEEYRDIHLTVEVFKSVLDESEFYHYSAGIVLQSYLPDAFLIQQDLTAWAIKRVSNGAAPIKLRLVKGANLAMEKVEASLRDWRQAPYLSKEEVDANYKRMFTFGCDIERLRAVKMGVASHNLFDIAYAMLLRAEKGVEKYINFEMLEGMADNIRRVVQALAKDVLLYCPTAGKDEFQNAVAYLIRRLDENTAPENFLRYVFDMTPGSQEWELQKKFFIRSCYNKNSVNYMPQRQQNRFIPPEQPDYDIPFHNEPDTDWALPQNRKWAESILKMAIQNSKNAAQVIPLVIGKPLSISDLSIREGIDPSFPDKTLFQYAVAGKNELESAIVTSIAGFKNWTAKTLRERLFIIDEVAQQLRIHRAELIGSMVSNTGKTVAEADVEVSEAIDFAAFYRRNAEEFHFIQDVSWKSKGPVLVASPWNFPCSIPAGGILAALAAGNSVIFKPAPEAVLVGWVLANIFWKAGIGQDVLQFFCCEDDPIGSLLIQDERIASVVLTGATSTAKKFLSLRPGMNLMAETGGKNALIITGMSDRDLAIKDVLQSAFGYAGQKCSACSLVILEKEVYGDVHFMNQLRNAASSLRVGSQWDLSTRVNPLIRPASEVLRRAMTSLDEGESWLLQPIQDTDNPHLWSPGIKLGVQPGSFMHQTELFGPILGVMCAKDLDDAIDMANGTPYGLTSGLHSLDEREQWHWQERIEAGNCYINRTITGAIVCRQPFGGCKESSFGRGSKAGGPNYVLQFMKGYQKILPKEKELYSFQLLKFDQSVDKSLYTADDVDLWNASLGSYSFYWNHYFSKSHDPSMILGQDNFLKYVPHKQTLFRIQEEDDKVDFLRVIASAIVCGAYLTVSIPVSMMRHIPSGTWLENQNSISLIAENEEQLIGRIAAKQIDRMRLISSPSIPLKQVIADFSCNVIVESVMANGRLELLNILREVSFSIDYHRYGYLGFRENEKRSALAVKVFCGTGCRCNC